MTTPTLRSLYILFSLALASSCGAPTSEAPEPPAEPAATQPGTADVAEPELLRIDRDTIADAVAADLEQRADDDVAEPEPLLDDLFDASGNPKPGTKIDTGLLTNEDGVTLKERLDGVEVTIEVPTR